MSFVRRNLSLDYPLISNAFLFVGLTALVMASFSYLPTNAFAQGVAEEKEKDPSAIELYEGPPIYLPVGEVPPPPKEVESREVKKKYDDSEAIRFERRVIRFSDDTYASNGPYKEYYKEGQLFSEGEYKLGEQIGDWTFYHPNGQLAKKISYTDGRPDGPIEIYNEEGKLISERTYKLGKREGKWVTYSKETGEPLTEQTFQGGLPDGTWKFWYSNGQLRQQQVFKLGKREGLVTEWSTTGEKRGEAEFANGVREGKSTEWRPTGEVIVKMFEAGKMVSQDATEPKG